MTRTDILEKIAEAAFEIPNPVRFIDRENAFIDEANVWLCPYCNGARALAYGKFFHQPNCRWQRIQDLKKEL